MAPIRLSPMYHNLIVPLPTPDPIPSFTQPFLITTKPGYDEEALILQQSLPIVASFLLQVFVYAPRIHLHLCWSIFCANYNLERQDMAQNTSKIFLNHSLHSKSIVFPMPHHVTLSSLSPPEKYTHTFTNNITAFPITIHSPSHLQDMDPTPYIQEYQEDEDIQILLQEQFVYEDDDDYIFIPDEDSPFNPDTFTAYKQVDKKIHPVSTQIPLEYQIKRKILTNSLDTLPPLPTHPPKFIPTLKITEE